jgi:hypothetical protein
VGFTAKYDIISDFKELSITQLTISPCMFQEANYLLFDFSQPWSLEFLFKQRSLFGKKSWNFDSFFVQIKTLDC